MYFYKIGISSDNRNPGRKSGIAVKLGKSRLNQESWHVSPIQGHLNWCAKNTILEFLSKIKSLDLWTHGSQTECKEMMVEQGSLDQNG